MTTTEVKPKVKKKAVAPKPVEIIPPAPVFESKKAEIKFVESNYREMKRKRNLERMREDEIAFAKHNVDMKLIAHKWSYSETAPKTTVADSTIDTPSEDA